LVCGTCTEICLTNLIVVGIDANLREAEIELHRLSEKYLIVQKNPTLHKVYISLRPTDFI